MTIYVDGDACPVKDIIIEVASFFRVPVHLFIDTSHSYSNPNIKITVVDSGPDSVDFAIMRLIKEKDLLITQRLWFIFSCNLKRCYSTSSMWKNN